MSEAAPETAPEADAKPDTDAPAAPEAELEEVDTEDAWDPKRAKEKIRKLNQEIKATKDRLAEAPKADDISAKNQRIDELEATAMRYEVAFDLGLPKEIAARLQGKTREEMVADAETLLELIAPAKRPASRRPSEKLRGGGEPDLEPDETDPVKLAARVPRL